MNFPHYRPPARRHLGGGATQWSTCGHSTSEEGETETTHPTAGARASPAHPSPQPGQQPPRRAAAQRAPGLHGAWAPPQQSGAPALVEACRALAGGQPPSVPAALRFGCFCLSPPPNPGAFVHGRTGLDLRAPHCGGSASPDFKHGPSLPLSTPTLPHTRHVSAAAL
ncbi:MAG: hypothetical protein J3K34DRAFT_437630 [Monoraphidium minutum]|nr:MAG: hypothetical protein J3K34DRAFT_437630 [Monoraphidium minutum]